MRTKLKLLFVCAVVLLLGTTPKALALVVGFNPDIHMDIQGVVANDFHVQGRLESGDPCGNWSNPPVLISHIDGGFPNFKYSITPDTSDPYSNWYIFTADWSGANYPYCSVIHLGLFFDVTCNNVVVNLVGWWTKDGAIPVPLPPFQPPVNGGSVPIPGFDVQDQPSPMHPQKIRLFNHSGGGGGGGGRGIETEIVQMDLVGLTKEELESKLGHIPGAFEELCYNGDQQYLPWVPVENEKGIISTSNPQPLLPDSFFDVFLDLSGLIHPVTPITIPPGGFLIAREEVKFINNNGEYEYRWDWMIHGAHESDLGDAPDSTNSLGALMTAYPLPLGIQANYPTVYAAGSPPYGPIHWAAPLIAFLGPMVSSEMEADIGPDMDPTNNIIPPNDTPDLDNFDDGVIFPIVMPHCQWTTFNYLVTIMPPQPPPMPQTPPLYVNVWCDWNRDGDWDDTMQCPGDTAPIPAPEWAVQNQPLVSLLVGLNNIPTPPFMSWHPATGDTPPIWMRITLSEQRWFPTPGVSGDGGSGPKYGYLYGETEDYYFTPEVPPPLKLDFGDAPEGSNAIAYPATGVTGAFPTCKTIGPAGWIQHTNFGAWFGPTVDFEGDGNGGLCPGCFPPYDQDECFNDGDAGLIVPQPYTIDASLNVVPCPLCSGGGTPLGDTCQTAFWGTDIDIDVHNHMPSQATGYVNLLIDWDQNGQWGGSSNCPTAATPEHVLVNFPVPNPYDGPLSGLMPIGAGFLIGPNRGYVWARFTITDQILPDNWNGEGSFEDGETEDYLLEIGKVYEPKPPVEHVKWSQPPIEWNPQSRTPVYCGWDEPSFKEEQGPALIWHIVADDFRCLGSMPITSIHWWGSYKYWEQPDPPAVKPTSWRIGFWSNVPPPPTGGISHPGKLLWQIEVPADRVSEEETGIDRFPDNPSDTCFQYYVNLTSKEYFRQAKEEPNTVDSVFWLSIAAVYPQGQPPPNPWGWKTRPWHWMDDAVTFTIAGDFKPGYVPDPSIFRPLEYCGQSYDAAFELDTDPNYIKWEQAYTGIRDWPHYEDEKSMATVDTVVEPVTKWIQHPDLTPMGIDVDATAAGMYPPQVLADDFNCTTTGPITDVNIWGSWLYDMLPPNGPQGVVFTLSLHADIPASQSPTGYSMPGKLLWMGRFEPGQFDVLPYATVPEGYYVPCTQPPIYWPNNHNGCWQYHFKLPPDPNLIQKGTPTNPVVYWLDVQAQPIGATNPEIRFGWKTSTEHNIDAAVYAVGVEPIRPPGPWQKLTYPIGHPYAGTTIDLAFQIVTQNQYEKFNLSRQVADDWRCVSKTPVTAAVWWGSYIGYGYEACQCQTTTPRPTKPDYFLLSIWTNVPATEITVAAGSSTGDVNVYNAAGSLLWNYKTGVDVASVDVSVDGAYVAVGSRGNKLYLFTRNGTKLWEKSVPIAYGAWGVGHESKSVAIPAYGEYVVAGCTDKLYVYRKDGTLHYSNAGQETCVEISPSGNYIASCNNADGTIHLFSNTATGCTLLWTKTISGAFWIATSDSGYVAVNNATTVYLYNSAGTQIWSYSHAKWDGDIIRVDMPQDGLSVVAVNDDPGNNQGCVLCYWNHLKDGTSGWSATDSTPVWTYDPGGAGSDYYSVAISGNGSYIATGGTQGPCLFASTSNVPLQTFGMGTTHQSLDLTDAGFGACGNSQGNLYYFSKSSNIPLWNKALGGNVHAVAVGGDPFSHPGVVKKWEYKADKYDEVLVGYDKHPEPGEPSPGGYEPVFRYSVKLPKESWFLQKDVNEVFWFSAVAVYDQNEPNYPWGWTNHQCVAWEPKGLDDEVAYWKLNETSGIIASDSSGNGNDGTLVGNPTWTAGKICGGALDLDGNGDYVKTANTTAGLNFAPGPFSVSAWIYPRQVTGSWRTILEYDRGGNNWFGLWLSDGGNFHFRVGSDTKNSNQVLNANQWYLLTATYDSISKTMSLYIDGQFDSSRTHSNGFTSPNVAKLTIGVRGWEDGEYFDGLVDDIRIYTRTLSASEVRALADMGKNDDAAAWELDPTGQWKWTPLTDQTGRSEDMSFVLFTEPECLIGGIAGPKEYTDWVAWGKPACWCYQRQCRGDANGKKLGFWVQLLDFQIMAAAYGKTDAQLALIPNGICADLNHKKIGFRVQLLDFQEIAKYYGKPDAQVPLCDAAPLTTGPYNFWTSP